MVSDNGVNITSCHFDDRRNLIVDALDFSLPFEKTKNYVLLCTKERYNWTQAINKK